jgi:hypothetical protein
MSEPPKFEVIDRRRMKAAEEEEQKQTETPAPAAEPEAKTEPAPGPRLVVNEGHREPESAPEAASPEAPEMPPAPTAAESKEQKAAYAASSERLDDLIRAQNPGAGPQPQMGFEHLIQQFYVSAMIQMGAGGQEGQRPRVDIVGARNTIDLLGVLEEKTRGNLNENEKRMLETVLFDVRMAFLELTSMINMQTPPPPPPVQ